MFLTLRRKRLIDGRAVELVKTESDSIGTRFCLWYIAADGMLEISMMFGTHWEANREFSREKGEERPV